MASKKSSLRPLKAASKAPDGELAKDLIKLIAVGLAGGLLTIAGAKKVGDEITKKK